MRYLWLAAPFLIGACPNDDAGTDTDTDIVDTDTDTDTVDTDTVDTDTVDTTDSGAGGTTPMR